MSIVVEASGIAIGLEKSKKYIKAVLQSFNTPNRNKRYYPLTKMQQAIEEYKEKVKNGEAFGELGHPDATSPERLATIDPKHVSHVIKEMYLENNLLKAIVKPVGPMKEYLLELAENGRIGFSVRVFAQKWYRNENAYVEPDGHIYIICYDAVIMPSHYEAYVEKIEVARESYIPELEGYSVECTNNVCEVKKQKMVIENSMIDAIKSFKPIKF
jgi:hypothetical protein